MRIEIDISHNAKSELQALFIANDVYNGMLVQEGEKFGYVCNASSGGEIFYFIRGKKKGDKLHNQITGEFIVL